MADVKDCCKQQSNLEAQPSDRKGLSLNKCKVCNCRHFTLTVDPGRLGAELQPLK